ncbi:MAG: bifunctional hydroxymethylpyrimidine kinase/phosphomethylpyrimidine kinase [Acidobacteria bacterium]|nr:MAG: bifunctional hydroxymethylpyrimidine kinase/phosphomethylpyrimidine kinase [Acidobacteriota bacterium]
MRTVLTIAGSDSGGGAGIQADLRTFQALGVFGTSAITAITAQNTLGVRAVHAVDASMVAAQIDAVAEDFTIAATKIGMLANAAIVRAVAAALDRHTLEPVVLDPVMIAKGGDALLAGDAVAALRSELLPRAAVLTPNIPEAEVLTGLTITSVAAMREAAAHLLRAGARAVVIKGGHLEGPAIDLFVDARSSEELRAPRLETAHTHGTGCTFASAIAARLALGDDLLAAVRAAKAYVHRAIERAPGLGHGHGPLGTPD